MSKKKHSIRARVFSVVMVICLMIMLVPANLSVDAATVKLNQKKIVLMKKSTYKLKLSGASKTIVWSSSNKKVATVSKKGKVTAKKAGTATITAKVGKKKYTCKVVIPNKSYTFYEGDTSTLKDASGLSGSIKWSSADKKVAKVSQKGKVTAVKSGETVITAKKGNKVWRAKIVVKAKQSQSTVTTHSHTWVSEITKEPDCTNDGVILYTCSTCGATYEDGIEALGHDYTVTKVAATCTKRGYTSYVCSRNSEHSYKTDYIAAGHTWSEGSYITRPTDENDGEIAYECSVCGKEKTETVAAGTDLLMLDKTVYEEGEDIMVTAIGADADWVGIYLSTDVVPDNESIYWYYVAKDGHTSGSTYSIQESNYTNASRSDLFDLPEGRYRIVLFENDGYTVLDEEYLTIGDVETPEPASVTYELENETDGLADGTVTITLQDGDDVSTDVVMYWADDNGPLDDYTSLAKMKLTGDVTTLSMYDNTIIPEDATRLLVYTSSSYGLSENYVAVDLPEGCNYVVGDENPVMEFDMVSDVHITVRDIDQSDYNYYNNEHFQMMLDDIVENDADSSGIFINGDIADTGLEAEYEQFEQYLNAVTGLPDTYLSIGNHDLSNGSYEEGAALFLQYANTGTDTVYYDKTVDGYHFIFMGSEATGLNAELSEAQLEWLDELLAADTESDPTKPVFVMLHQSLYDTVAGSFEGQGWNGVNQEEELRTILKKYPQVILFNGHSHWELNSEGCMYEADSELPTIFNSASAAYLWTSYDVTTGESLEGSQGYFVKVYSDKILVFGRDFVEGKYIPSAAFVVSLN